jgi:ABC-type multidrug transport system fused ATPase/permease subunit
MSQPATPAEYLSALARRHRFRLTLTYALTLTEYACRILYPALIGYAIDQLLKGNMWGLAPLLGTWLFHATIGLGRQVYDTYAFTHIYNEMVIETVERQRNRGVESEKIAARVSLSRELVDFFQYEIPALTASVILFLGSIIMLFAYDVVIGIYAAIALIPISLAYAWFGKRSYRLNRGLNNRLEREVEIVQSRPLAQVARHLLRARKWRISISNAQAGTWSVIELVMLVLTAATLTRLAGIDGITPGIIYAVIAYIFDYYESVNDLPIFIQNTSRAWDIGERIVSDERKE